MHVTRFSVTLRLESSIYQFMSHLSAYFPITDPTLVFFVVLCIILFAPIIMGKLRIPHIIGMVLAGVLVGQYGFNILVRDNSFELFGNVGMYYIMFLAGLEMDMEGLKKNTSQFLIFGLLTALVPMAITYPVATLCLHYSPSASLLLSCIMASNTLIAYPIAVRFGLQRHRSVALSVGSTMLALFIALMVLAGMTASLDAESQWWFWPLFLFKVTLFCTGMIVIIPRITRKFLRRYSDAVMQFIFIMAVLFLSAALSEAVGLEGIFGAFFAGLILNRYIPRLSSLMNRIEFIGNAIFIPYFLIGVGMLINVRILFQGGSIVWVAAIMIAVAILSKAAAAYTACFSFKMPLSSGHMMFGLTSAHAAGGIAMVMVGMRLQTMPGQPLVNDDMLNGVIIMILFTCIISTIRTEYAARQLILSDRTQDVDQHHVDDEKILLPVKYPEVAQGLVSVAVMMRNPKLNRGLVALNVVYDDKHRAANQKSGRILLDNLEKVASAADVKMQTQVRVAANIANGIKFAFKEFDASEIIMGMHIHKDVSPKFWGEFAQSLYNGLNRQIIFVRLKQPLNTLRCIQVAVPSRAEFEPGFYRWLERLARLAGNLECRIVFHGREEQMALVANYLRHRHPNVRSEFTIMSHWKSLPQLAASIHDDHLFVVVTSRKGGLSYKTAMEQLPDEIEKHFLGKSMMLIFPDQYGERESMTFAESQHQEEKSAYQELRGWLHHTFHHKKNRQAT